MNPIPAVDRRNFLARAVRLSGGAVFAPSLAGLVACDRYQTTDPGTPDLHRSKRIPRAGKGFGGYGQLAVSQDCPQLLIPEGFRCAVLSTSGQPSLADPSFEVPIAFDGMAAFSSRRGRIRLVRNHEVRDAAGAAPAIGSNPYDPQGGAGTTTLEVRVLRGHRREVTDVVVEKEFVSLAGTIVNCAGGPTPWGSWITCEETTAGVAAGFSQPHGYVFDVAAHADGPVTPIPLPALGRFVHEAVAVDPETGIVYLTEDAGSAGFYRFIPRRRGRLEEGGRLQVLAVQGRPGYDTRTGQERGETLPARWVDIEDPDPANAESSSGAVFAQGSEQGAAIFARLEGCWYGDDSVYFNATSGGDVGLGQVWQYRPWRRPERRDGDIAGTLSLIYESPGADVLDSPDNIAVSPRGGIVLCEDGDGTQFLRGLTRRGEIFDLAQTNGALTEFAGATFSRDGDVLFFNIQGATRIANKADTLGYTFAMWGPWEEGAL